MKLPVIHFFCCLSAAGVLNACRVTPDPEVTIAPVLAVPVIDFPALGLTRTEEVFAGNARQTDDMTALYVCRSAEGGSEK